MFSYQIQKFSFTDEPATDTATVYANGIKTLLANGLSAFFIKGIVIGSHFYLKILLIFLFYGTDVLILLY